MSLAALRDAARSLASRPDASEIRAMLANRISLDERSAEHWSAASKHPMTGEGRATCANMARQTEVVIDRERAILALVEAALAYASEPETEVPEGGALASR